MCDVAYEVIDGNRHGSYCCFVASFFVCFFVPIFRPCTYLKTEKKNELI